MSSSEMTIRNELAWLANCYVLGELSADEATRFEARLADDVAACDAVAQAMRLNLAVAVAIEDREIDTVVRPVTSDSQSAPRSTGIAIKALAVSVIVAASLALMFGRGVDRKDGADKLVADWTSGEAARNAADDDDGLDSDNDADLDPPDWMLAALTDDDSKEQLPDQDEVREN